MSTTSLIQVLSVDSEEVLFECETNKAEEAFEYAAKMEQMGIEVRVVSPTITESLCDSLGIELDKRADYEQSVFEEIADHDGSCCAGPVDLSDTKIQ